MTDCRQFILSYSSCIHAAPLQLYHSVLNVAPTISDIRNRYAHKHTDSPIVECGIPTNWRPCADTFMGSSGSSVEAVAFSSDGNYFATGDKIATVWTTLAHTPVSSFNRHTGCVLSITFSPDGQHVASGSQDGNIYIWNTLSADSVGTLKGHAGAITSVTYSKDGRHILSAADRGDVKLWHTADERCLLALRPMSHNVTYQAGISPNGNIIAQGDGTTLRLHNVSAGSSEALCFPGLVEACTFSPDGRYVAARSWYDIKVWACENKKLLRSISVSDELAGRLAFSHDGMTIGCGFEDGSVRWWQVASQTPPLVLHGCPSCVNDIACSPRQPSVISVSKDGLIRVWNGILSSAPHVEHSTLEPPSSSAPSPGSARLALVRLGGRAAALLNLSDLALNAEHIALNAQIADGSLTVTLFSGANSAWDSILETVSDWRGRAVARAWAFLVGQRHTQLSERPIAVALDGSLMAYPSPTSDKTVDVYNLRRTAVVARLIARNNGVVRSIALSSDNTYLATGSIDGAVEVFRISTAKSFFFHKDHESWISATTFSPDGQLVASASEDKTVRIYEFLKKTLACVLYSHRGDVTHVMFAADNTHLVALDNDSRIAVWNITTQMRIHESSLEDHRLLRSPILSSEDTGLLVPGIDGAPHSISLWKPGTRTWPTYHVTRDGWVYAMSPGKACRLCWVPLSALSSEANTLFMRDDTLGTYARRVIVLKMSRLLDYYDERVPVLRTGGDLDCSGVHLRK